MRRAIVLNIRLDADSLAVILDRTRDVEPMTRKLVYMNVLLPNINIEDAEGKPIMGLTHPRALTIAQRELIVSNGLGFACERALLIIALVTIEQIWRRKPIAVELSLRRSCKLLLG